MAWPPTGACASGRPCSGRWRRNRCGRKMPNQSRSSIINATEHQVAAVRAFNRSYTRQIGVLNRDFLDTAFSLAEVRVLLELYYHDGITASAIGQPLGLDAGYLSRILRGFAGKGLIAREGS